LLKERHIAYRYREYTEEPLTIDELKHVFSLLGVAPKTLLRKNDKAYKENGLSGDETEEDILTLMSAHPTLLQRPIGVLKDAACVGRPPEALLDLFKDS
jgi:arsenate reductase